MLHCCSCTIVIAVAAVIAIFIFGLASILSIKETKKIIEMFK